MTSARTAAIAAVLGSSTLAAHAGTLVYNEATAGFEAPGVDVFNVNSPDVPAGLNISPVEISFTRLGGQSTLTVNTAADITGSGYQTLILDTDGNGSADVEVGYENGTIFTQTRDGAGAFNSGNYSDGLGWTGKNVGSLVAGGITFSTSGLGSNGFTLTTSDLGIDALVAGFGIYSDQGLQGTYTIDGNPVNFSGNGENVIFAEGNYFGDENVSMDAPFIGATIIPLPHPAALATAGLVGVGVMRRRRR